MTRGFCLILALSACLARSQPVVYHIETVAGSDSLGDGGKAVNAQIGTIQGVAADRSGNLYISDTDHHRVRKIWSTSIITTLAGTGTAGFSGDGGPAAKAQLNLPYGVAVDASGNVYIADLGNQRVRRVAADGTITTVAGTGDAGYSGDGGAAALAKLHTPRNVAVDAWGNLYISEFEGHRVRKVASNGIITTAAGNGMAGFGGDGGPATSAQLGYPAGLASGSDGALYIADSQNNRIRKVSQGVISTVLGGTAGTALTTPIAVALDWAGNLYVADSGFVVRVYTAAGVWSNFAGTGAQGFSGDGAAASQAFLTQPRDLAASATTGLYIADGVRLRQVDSAGVIHTLAGDAYLHAVGDSGAATAAILNQPASVTLDTGGNLYIADPGTERVRQVRADGTIATLAGTGSAGSSGDGGAAAAALLNTPMGVAVDSNGNVAIADSYNHRIRQVGTAGGIATIVGTGTSGMGQDSMPALQTPLRAPRGVCFDRSGLLYIADTANHRILRLTRAGLVETAAGNGSAGASGDGGPARYAQLNQPAACALDSAGYLFIADTLNHRIRKVTPAGTISTVAGTGDAGNSGDGGAATAARLQQPAGVAADDNGNIFIADTGNHSIRQVTAGGTIRTIAGQGTAGYSGDGGLASSALLHSPEGLVLDGAGDLYFADSGNQRVRRLVPQSAAEPLPIVTPPVTLSAVNAASAQQGAVAPGEILTLYGSALGPVAGVSASFDNSGALPLALSGTEVRFDGIAAPLFYTQAAQVNVQVPYGISGQSTTHVEAFYQGASVGSADLNVADASPALFPVAFNQDGTINSAAAPAARGTIVTFYATGEGMTTGPNLTGRAAAAPYPSPRLPASLTIGAIAADLLFGGSAPGLAGTLQVNARVPGAFLAPGRVAVQLQVGDQVSPAFAMWIQ
jgi:trimeric autotransporter adhesin